MEKPKIQLKKFSVPVVIGLGLSLLHAVIILIVLDESVGRGDTGAYLSQARAILDGDIATFIKDSTYMMENSYHIGPIAYPWGLPLLIATTQVLVGWDYLLLKIPAFLLMLVFLYVFAQVGFRRIGWWIIPTILVFIVNPQIAFFANTILSDYIFVALAGLILVVYKRLYLMREANEISATWYYFFLAILILVPQTIRPNAAVIAVIALLGELYFFFRVTTKRLDTAWRFSFYAILGNLVFLISAIVLWKSLFPFGNLLSSHKVNPIALSNIPGGIKYYFDTFSQVWWLSPAVSKACTAVLLVPFGMGMFLDLKRNPHFVLFVLGNLGVYFLIDMKDGIRYLFPLFPFFFYFIFLFACEVDRRLEEKWKYSNRTFWGMLTFVLVVHWTLHIKPFDGIPPIYANSSDSYEVYEFLESVPEGPKLMSLEPRALYYFTKRPSFATYHPEVFKYADYRIFDKNDINFKGFIGSYKTAFENQTYVVLANFPEES